MTKFKAYNGGLITVLGVTQIEVNEDTNEVAQAMFVRTQVDTDLKRAFEHTALGRSYVVTDVIPLTDDLYLILVFSSLNF